ncbi:MAG: Crp/Fnr family transcriptional regulator [Puniceicoccaceae bacterium]
MSPASFNNPSDGGLLSRPTVVLSPSEKADLLDESPWAGEFSYAHIEKLANCMDVYEVPAETVLFNEGDRNPYFVLILKGQVDVAKLDAGGHSRRIATLGPGKTIGDMIIIDGEPRSASARTRGPAMLMVMTGKRFEQLVEQNPRVAMILLFRIARLLSQHLRKTSGRLLDHLGQEDS